MTDFNLQIGEEKKVIKHINVFDLNGKHFKVQAKQTVRNYYGIMPNENAWCLYMILYPSHPLFEQAAANTTDYDTDLGNKIYPNWHGGCTYYHKNNDYVKIGCDYQHVGDEEIEHDFSDGINGIVLYDMRNLYEFFSK